MSRIPVMLQGSVTAASTAAFPVLTAALAFWLSNGAPRARSVRPWPLWCQALDSIPSFLQLHLSAQQTLVNAAGEELEGTAHILARLGGHLHVGQPQLPGQNLGLLSAHHPYFIFVALVSHQDEENLVRAHVVAHLAVPLFDVLEGGSVGHVEHQQASGRVAVVGTGHRPEGKGETRGLNVNTLAGWRAKFTPNYFSSQ